MAQVQDFKAKRASDISTSTTAAQLFQAADGSGNVKVIIPAATKVFYVRATGTATGGTTTNFNPTIYWGTTTTTTLVAHSATAYNSASGGWMLEAQVQYDSVSSKLHGLYDGYIGTTPTVVAATIMTDIASVTTVDGKTLIIGGTFSVANASNKATLDEFALEVWSQAK